MPGSKTMKGTKGTMMTAKQTRRFLRNQKRKAAGLPGRKGTQTGKVFPIPAKTWVTDSGSKKKKSQIGDTRASLNTSMTLEVSTAQPSITVSPVLTPQTLFGVCIAYVSAALSRGYLAYAASPNDPYFAAIYMVNVLIAYAQGVTPAATKLPYWLQCLGQALSPKKVPMGQGNVFYRFNINTTIPYTIPVQGTSIGYGPYGYLWQAYVSEGSGSVNGFPLAADPAAYNDTDGAQSWASLAQSMIVEGRPWTEVVDLCPTTWAKNVSAFALAAVPEGQGYQGVGGQGFQAQLEVPIHTPTLATFTNDFISAAFSVSANRWPGFVSVFAGDCLLTSAMFSTIAHPKQLGTKKMPLIHALDFLELQEIMADYVQGLLEQAALSSLTSAGITDITTLQCPLSLQEMGLLLRNELMTSWATSQAATQSFLPRAPSADTDNEFVAYLATSATCGLKAQGMKLPNILVENINALQMRWVREGTGKETTDRLFIPCLGQYRFDNLDPTSYQATVSIEGVPTTFPVFNPNPTFRRKRSKSKVVPPKKTSDPIDDGLEVVVEAPISFIDGTSGSSIVFMNDPTRLQELVTLWNNWLPTFATYSVPLAVVGRDLGVNICSSVGLERHWINSSPARLVLQAEFVDERIQRKRNMVGSPYSGRQQIAITSHDRTLSAPFEKIQSIWWLPTNYSAGGASLAAQSLFPRQQSLMKEPISVPSASQNAGSSLASLHVNYAQMMVHGALAPPSEVDEFFKNQAVQGHGGVLSGLVSGFLGKAFGPTVGSIAGSVAEMLPI